MQQDQEFESEDDEKIIAARFTSSGPIDLGSYSSEEMKIATLGIATDGLIDLGSVLGNETNISAGVVPKMKRSLNVAWLQELEEINQSIQMKNV